MSAETKTWPYGSTRGAKVLGVSVTAQVVMDESGEGHILCLGAHDPEAVAGDQGKLTFTEGGPTGGYWKFKKGA